jgi:hypothetical protein
MNDKANLEAKKTGGGGAAGLAIILAIGVGAFVLSRRAKGAAAAPTAEGEVTLYPTQKPGADPTKPLGSPENPLYTEIPGELISLDEWYVTRDIKNVLGWSLEEFKRQIALVRETPVSEMTAEQRYAAGYVATWDEAEYFEARQALIKQTGGSWVNGVLTPPPGYNGSATDYAIELREMLKSSENSSVAAVANKSAEPVPVAADPLAAAKAAEEAKIAAQQQAIAQAQAMAAAERAALIAAQNAAARAEYEATIASLSAPAAAALQAAYNAGIPLDVIWGY